VNSVHLVHNGFIKPTKEAADLKDELIKRGVKVYVELNDGYKRVDLALPGAKLNIEVDGIQHLTDPRQIVSDLARGYYSSKLGYDTMHIPNEMVRKHLQQIAEALATTAKIRQQQLFIHLTR
jgi:very-short-patch-repair endonuclease